MYLPSVDAEHRRGFRQSHHVERNRAPGFHGAVIREIAAQGGSAGHQDPEKGEAHQEPEYAQRQDRLDEDQQGGETGHQPGGVDQESIPGAFGGRDGRVMAHDIQDGKREDQGGYHEEPAVSRVAGAGQVQGRQDQAAVGQP